MFLVKTFLLLFHNNFDSRFIAENERNLKLSKALKKYCKLSSVHYRSYEDLKDNCPVYDLYITGSDQTWNPLHIKGDTNFMLGFVPKEKPKMSFSASMSCNEIQNDTEKEVYKKYLSLYSYISIREKNNQELIKELSGKENVEITLDPTLLLTKEEWLKEFLKEKLSIKLPQNGYIVLYMLSYAFDPQPYIYELLKSIQDKTGKVVLSFTKIDPSYQINYRYVGGAGLRDFMEIFANASAIVTSSFHGTAFALNFGIPLYSVVPQNYKQVDSRQIDIIEKVEANKYLIPKGTDLDTVSVDYNKSELINIQKNLASFRAKSVEWLSKSIEACK